MSLSVHAATLFFGTTLRRQFVTQVATTQTKRNLQFDDVMTQCGIMGDVVSIVLMEISFHNHV